MVAEVVIPEVESESAQQTGMNHCIDLRDGGLLIYQHVDFSDPNSRTEAWAVPWQVVSWVLTPNPVAN